MTRTRMPIPILAILALAVVVIIATSGGSKASTQTAINGSSAISIRHTPAGPTLVDANGRTLYLFAGDTRNLSRLSAAGRAIWPPFTAASTPAATGGALAAQVGSIPAGAGTRQITYNGHPLYYYVGDHAPGQVAGQGLNEFGARWYVVSAAGRAITASPSRSQGGSTSSPAGGAGGSSYSY
jgi:predicted lipoprotein with Yx(FWY)xxD motif